MARSEETSMQFKGTNKFDGWQYPTAVVWKDHLYVAYSINKEDRGCHAHRSPRLVSRQIVERNRNAENRAFMAGTTQSVQDNIQLELLKVWRQDKGAVKPEGFSLRKYDDE